MRNKKLLLIAAVAVMLVAATSAYGYWEAWDGWFNSGYLIYLGDTYDYVSGEGILEDRTFGSVDSFYINTVTPGIFTCTRTGYTIKLWVTTPSGSKDTGQEGQKQVDEAEWSGNAIRIIPQPPPNPPKIDTFTVVGTWNTRAPNDYFDYTMCPCPPATPTYSAHWIVSYSVPWGITGGKGGSAGDRIYYEE
ncbi:hypothetical protein CEE36_02535 [candidate division TA06 bacterium B3_TA06]|uniref:Uncharacterized protein n=1 Tax=candidate division TA06 bacterium B3_TA06 TaxID=2012487 RepID=A0A532V9Z9_UNCT6|nr:MAG: hypothetical protein CEE36_02535 [candidate division TA06 bacterium B3_TA06]